MTVESKEGGMLRRRYNYLITAFRRAAHNQGWDLNVIESPEYAEYPFVVMCMPTTEAGIRLEGHKELLFLFAERNPFVQSSVIADIFRHLRSYQEEISSAYLLFDEESRTNVEQVIQISGLDQLAKLQFYRRVDGAVLFDWSPGRNQSFAHIPAASEAVSIPLVDDRL